MLKSVMNLTRRATIGLGIATLLVQAGFAESSPKQFIESLSKTVIDALSRGAGQQERQNLFRDLLNKAVDTESVGRFALGRYARTATPEQIENRRILQRLRGVPQG